MEGKKKRKPNWTADERLTLVNYVAEYKDIVRGKLGPLLTSEKKKATWKLVTERLNASFTAVKRTTDEVEKKWHNILSVSKAEICTYKKEQVTTGGGSSTTELSDVARVVWDILGDNNACLAGIDGGIDSSLLQISMITDASGTGANPQNAEPTTSHTFLLPPPPSSCIIPAINTSQTVPRMAQDQLPLSVDPKTNQQVIEELTIKKLKLEIEFYETKLRQMKSK